MKYLLFISFAYISTLSQAQEKSITTFILIRHAEKEGSAATMQTGVMNKDPELSETGKARALRLADMLQRQPVAAIYSTNYRRTSNTVKPLADALAQPVQLYEAFKEEEIDKMLSQHKGKTIVVVGHSNNIPWIANLLLGKKEFSDYEESDYENMLIVNVVAKGKATSTLQIKY